MRDARRANDESEEREATLTRSLALWEPDTELTPEASRRMRQEILRRAAERGGDRRGWFEGFALPLPIRRPAAGLVAAVLAVAAFVVVVATLTGGADLTGGALSGRRSSPARPPAMHGGIALAERPPALRPRQIQFLAPHGTRIIWRFESVATTARSLPSTTPGETL
jgi:hypothetical protein